MNWNTQSPAAKAAATRERKRDEYNRRKRRQQRSDYLYHPGFSEEQYIQARFPIQAGYSRCVDCGGRGYIFLGLRRQCQVLRQTVEDRATLCETCDGTGQLPEKSVTEGGDTDAC